jgi:hypothetical protein
MPEPSSPEDEAEWERLREMAEQLRGALAVLKKQIDASSPPTTDAVSPEDPTPEQPRPE